MSERDKFLIETLRIELAIECRALKLLCSEGTNNCPEKKHPECLGWWSEEICPDCLVNHFRAQAEEERKGEQP